jgi:ActR/RegA family two-component response regulator
MPGVAPLDRKAPSTHILLVEGDDVAAAELRDALVHPGWDVTRASTVLEAIRAAGEMPFDAAVLEADLPDGSGVDLLNFLRITSPNIRIMVLSTEGSEEVAFRALSTGAGDFLVKNRHLAEELPRRIDALLEAGDATGALVETLLPSDPSTLVIHEDVEEAADADPPEPPARRRDATRPELEPALDAAVGKSAFAAAVYDSRGRILAERLVPPLDAHNLGFGLASIHNQVASLWATSGIKPISYAALVRIEGGLLGITAVPGQILVALLMPEDTGASKALERLTGFARSVSEALDEK